MNDYLPQYYSDSLTVDSIVDPESEDFEQLDAAVKDVLDQFYISSATWGLDRWEKLFEVPTNPALTYEQRRANLLSKQRGVGTVTVSLIKEVAETYDGGEVAVSEYVKNMLPPFANWTLYASGSTLANFVGKVSGSTVENPNVFKHNNGNPSTGLLAPSSSVFSETSGGYSLAAVLDGSTAGISNTNSGAQAQELFSFNLIAIVERKYGITIPGADTAAKVAWLKTNVTKLNANWYGYGSGPSGNKAALAEWLADTSSWNTWGSHTSANVTKISAAETTNKSRLIDANGFGHYLAYSDAAALSANPTVAPTLTASGSGSALTAGTYYVRYSWTNANGETLPSPETAVTITAGQNINVTTPAFPFGITSMRVYIAKQEVQNFVGKLAGNVETLTNNFVGKIGASTVENPNKTFGSSQSTLQAPTGTWSEFGTSAYTAIATLDGSKAITAPFSAGSIGQQLFSFDLISIVERKYGVPIPGAGTAAKVTWLKANVSKLTANWYGYGSGPAGNKATFAVWTGSAWGGASSHTSGAVQKIPYTTTTAISAIIDSSGFMHVLAYADASDGTTASTINTDYVELLVDVVQLVVSNPNISKRFGNQTALTAPSAFTVEADNTMYTQMSTLNGALYPQASSAGAGFISQQLFSFDLIAITEKRRGSAIPGADVAAKVTWLKANMTNLTANWYGYGSGPAGNKATLARWNVSTSAYPAGTSHTSGTVSKIGYSLVSVDMPTVVDANGFCHFLAYADASDGTTASVINTDFVELQITYTDNNTRLQTPTGSTSYTQSAALVTGQFTAAANNAIIASTVNTDYVELEIVLNAVNGVTKNAQATGDYGMTLTATSATMSSVYSAIAAPNTTYTLSFSPVASGGGYAIDYLDENSNWIGSANNGALIPSGTSITTPARTKYIKLIATNTAAGTFVFSNPQIELGAAATSFEPRKSYTIGITFIGTRGIPSNISDTQQALRDIIPAHLGIDFIFTYLAFDELDSYAFSWNTLDGKALTWNAFETYRQ
jgi:hypothetical protein